MTRTLKAGVIGLGFMGRTHIANLEKMPNVEVVAIADAEPARRANDAPVAGNIKLPAPTVDFTRLQQFSDGRDLIAQADVDFVSICLPTNLHAEFAILAAESGRHVVVEKPMALSTQEAQRMVDAAHRNHVELMVAQCVRFWPEFTFLRDAVKDGRMGKLLNAEFTRRSSQPVWSWQRWMNDASRSGGAILDLHIHDVDFMNHMLGMPAQVYATGTRTAVTGGYDLVSALFSYPNGVSVRIEGGWYFTPAFGFNAAFQGVFEKGIIRYNGAASPHLTVLRNDSAEVETPETTGDAYYNELEFFVNCLLEGKSAASFLPPESSMQSLQLVEAEIASMESGKPVQM
jgi:predicted dehydrogenase